MIARKTNVVALPEVDFDSPIFSSVEELAVALGKAERSIRERAQQERWLSTTAPCHRGRRKVFPIHTLPDKVREALLAHRVRSNTPVAAGTEPRAIEPSNRNVGNPGQMAEWQRRRAEARALILQHLEAIAAGIGIKKAVELVVEAAKRGELPPELQAKVGEANARAGAGSDRTLSRPTLLRWRAELRDARERGDTEEIGAALAPIATVREIERPWAGELLRLYQRPQKRSLRSVLEDLADRLPEGIAMPTYGQALRFINSMSPQQRERGRRSPNALLALKSYVKQTTDHLSPMELVTADGHTFKASVAHPVHGQPFRPEVCAVMDVRTRRVVGWSIGLAESTHVVMDALRHAAETGGGFGTLRTDNGAGFKSKVMTGEVMGFAARIAIHTSFSTPGRAQARGKIERLQQTLFIPAAKKLPTFAGKDMDRDAAKLIAKRIEKDLKATGRSRALISWEDFYRFLAQEVAAYNRRPHRGLARFRDPETGNLRHLSPDEAWARHEAEGWKPETLHPAVLEDLFRPYMERTTQRGLVTLAWGQYFAEALVPLTGQKVRVGYDVHDGSKVWVRDGKGRLVCVAIRNGNARQEIENAAAHSLAARTARRMKNNEAKKLEIWAEGGVLPAPVEPSAPTEREAEVHAALEAEFEAAPARIESRKDRYLRAIALADLGDAISEADAAWLSAYRRGREFQNNEEWVQEHGLAALDLIK